MRVLLAIACVFALFIVAGPKPASALPAAAALDYSPTNADLIEVRKKKYKKRYKRRYRGRHYRPYRYRPYRYGYRPYYRPYRYRWWW